MHAGRLFSLGGYFFWWWWVFFKKCSTEAENTFPHSPKQSDVTNIQSQSSQDYLTASKHLNQWDCSSYIMFRLHMKNRGLTLSNFTLGYKFLPAGSTIKFSLSIWSNMLYEIYTNSKALKIAISRARSNFCRARNTEAWLQKLAKLESSSMKKERVMYMHTDCFLILFSLTYI